MLTITVAMVQRSLFEALRKFGHDYIDPGSAESFCVYQHTDDEGNITPSCIVGQVLASVGLLGLLPACDEQGDNGVLRVIEKFEGSVFHIEDGAAAMLKEAQSRQDGGATWGDAVLAAFRAGEAVTVDAYRHQVDVNQRLAEDLTAARAQVSDLAQEVYTLKHQPTPPTAEEFVLLDQHTLDLIASGLRIFAIKRVRVHTGAGLKESKEAIETPGAVQAAATTGNIIANRRYAQYLANGGDLAEWEWDLLNAEPQF